MTTKRRSIGVPVASIVALVAAQAIAGDAAAQTSPPAPPTGSISPDQPPPGQTAPDTATTPEGLGEIVVTARKFAERLQEVPLAISAFDATKLSEKAAVNLEALSNSIPNVRLEHVGLFASAAAFTMRGVGQAGVESHDDPRVALYIDGAYQSRSAVGLGDMFDVEQVEVLRGPQGALFGRNAFAGAISLRSRRPTDEFEGNVEATVGAFDRRELKAAVNVPIVDGVLTTRVAVMLRKFGGFFRIGNTNPTLSVAQQSALVGRDLTTVIGERIGGEDKRAFRGIAKFTPTDNVEANLIVTRTEAENDGSPTVNQRLPGSVFGALGFPGRDPFGDAGRGIEGDGTDPFVTGSNYGNRYDIDDWDILGDLTVQLSDTVEWFTIADYKTQDSTILTDTDGELVDLFSSDRLERYKSFQVESRIQAELMDGRLKALAGVFYLNDQFDLYQRLQTGFGNNGDTTLTPPVPAVPPFQFSKDGRGLNNSLQFDGQRRWSISPFAQVNFNITDQIRLNAAVRFSYEKKRAFNFPLQQVRNVAGTFGIAKDFRIVNENVRLAFSCGEAETSSSNLSPNIGVDYKPNRDFMVYAQWQRAFKSAGLNVNAQTCATFREPYKDEQVDNFEIGLKSDLLGGHLRLNLTAFWAEYKNLQRSVIRVNPFNVAAAETFTSNAAGARIRGLEAEVNVIPVTGLNIYGTAGYLDSKYKGFCADLDGPGAYTGTPVSPCGGLAQALTPTLALIAVDNSNLRLTYAPEFSGQIGARYTGDVGAGKITFDTSISHTSRLETSVLNQNFTDRKPLDIWDASLTYADAQNRFRVIAWARNIADDVGRLSATYVSPLFIFSYPTERRTYGVTLGVNF